MSVHACFAINVTTPNLSVNTDLVQTACEVGYLICWAS